MAVDLTNPYAQELAGIERNRALAQALIQSGQQQPQGQMISGRYVAPSFAQNLAPIAQTFAGSYISNKADEKAVKTAQQLRDLYADEIKGYREASKIDPEAAMLKYSMAFNPALAQSITKQLTQGPKWEQATQYNKEKGVYEKIVYDANSSNPEATKRVVAIEKPEASWADKEHVAQGWANVNLAKAKAADEGVPIGGTGGGAMPTSNMPMVGRGQPTMTPVVNQSNVRPVSIAPNAPAYAQNAMTMQPTNAGDIPVPPQISLSNVSPKEQRALAGETQKALQTNVKNAYDAYPILKDIQTLLPKSSSGYVQRGWTGFTRAVNYSTDMSKADTALDVLAPKLTMFQPRFEGPQGKDDVKIYQAMAGRLSDTTLPFEDRMAALEQLKSMYQRYAPNLDWSFSQNQSSAPNASKSSAPSQAPAGVDPAVWAVMTPAEKSLWK